MRNSETIRKILKGDYALAQSYIGAARKQLGVWENYIKPNGPGRFVRTLPDGTVIEVGRYGSEKYIKITAGAGEEIVYSGYACEPASDSATDGWGKPYTAENVPLGTVGGTYPEVILTTPVLPELAGTRDFIAVRASTYLDESYSHSADYNADTVRYANVDWRGTTPQKVLSYVGPRNRYFNRFRASIEQTINGGSPSTATRDYDATKDCTWPDVAYWNGSNTVSQAMTDLDAWNEHYEETEEINFVDEDYNEATFTSGDDYVRTGTFSCNDIYEAAVYHQGVIHNTSKTVMGAAIQDNYLVYLHFQHDVGGGESKELQVYRRVLSKATGPSDDVLIGTLAYDDTVYVSQINPFFFNPSGTEARGFRFKKEDSAGLRDMIVFEELRITIDPNGTCAFESVATTGKIAVDHDGTDWKYLKLLTVSSSSPDLDDNVITWDDGTRIFPAINTDSAAGALSAIVGGTPIFAYSFNSGLAEYMYEPYYLDIRFQLALVSEAYNDYDIEDTTWKFLVNWDNTNTYIAGYPTLGSEVPYAQTTLLVGQSRECNYWMINDTGVSTTGVWLQSAVWSGQNFFEGVYSLPSFGVVVPFDGLSLSVTQYWEDLTDNLTEWTYNLHEVGTDLVRDTAITGDNPRFYPANIL